MVLSFELAGAVSLFLTFIAWLVFNQLLDILGIKAQSLGWSVIVVFLSFGLGMFTFFLLTGASALDWILA